jgi:hypothetical protein
VPELDRIVLKDTIAKRAFASSQACRKTAITTRILGLVHELCNKQINVTKRDLFYTDVKLFEVGPGTGRVLHAAAVWHRHGAACSQGDMRGGVRNRQGAACSCALAQTWCCMQPR